MALAAEYWSVDVEKNKVCGKEWGEPATSYKNINWMIKKKPIQIWNVEQETKQISKNKRMLCTSLKE